MNPLNIHIKEVIIFTLYVLCLSFNINRLFMGDGQSDDFTKIIVSIGKKLNFLE